MVLDLEGYKELFEGLYISERVYSGVGEKTQIEVKKNFVVSTYYYRTPTLESFLNELKRGASDVVYARTTPEKISENEFLELMDTFDSEFLVRISDGTYDIRLEEKFRKKLESESSLENKLYVEIEYGTIDSSAIDFTEDVYDYLNLRWSAKICLENGNLPDFQTLKSQIDQQVDSSPIFRIDKKYYDSKEVMRFVKPVYNNVSKQGLDESIIDFTGGVFYEFVSEFVKEILEEDTLNSEIKEAVREFDIYLMEGKLIH